MTSRNSFHSLASLNGEATVNVDDLLQENPQLNRQTVLAMQATARWAIYLGAELDGMEVHDHEMDGESPQEIMETYLDTMGYLPEDRKIIGHSKRSSKDVSSPRAEIEQRLGSARMSVEDLLSADPSTLGKEVDASKSRIELLQNMVRHELSLDELEVDELNAHFPFPITQHNFFGRFIAGGTEDPTTSKRHLQMSAPFFVRMRSLIEGLSQDKRNHLLLSPRNRQQEKKEKESDGPHRKPKLPISEEDLHAIVHSMVANSSDLHDPSQERQKLALIKVPPLPVIDGGTVRRKEMPQFTAEYYDWLLTGEEPGEIMTRRVLTISEEADCKSMKRELEVKRKKHKLVLKQEPPKDARRTEQNAWSDRLRRVVNRIEYLETQIKQMNKDRAKVRSIHQRLASGTEKRIEKLRDQVAQAQQDDAKIVFSFLEDEESNYHTKAYMSDQHTTFLTLMDRAYVSNNQDSEGIQIMKGASSLMDTGAANRVMRAPGGNSMYTQAFRTFDIEAEEINPSLQYIGANIVPKKMDPKLDMLLGHLISFDIPGVGTETELRYLVQQASGKRNPKPDDFMEYAFDRLANMSQDDLREILNVQRMLGYSGLSERCRRIAIDRFNLPQSILEQYDVYNTQYQPNQIGDLPMIFRDLATLDDHQSMHLEGFGMGQEVQELEHHLQESGIVAVVDSTVYHPELAREISGERMKEDTEMTSEVWGDYTRPSARLEKAFAMRMMEGRVDDSLKNHSLVAPHKPEKLDRVLERLYKKILGIDANFTPDLSQINRLISDLTIHDANTIIVINAENVKDLEQYRQFVDLLKKYNIKAILRLRESIPGVPTVNIQPFLDHEIPERLQVESESLRRKFNLREPISPEIIKFACSQVKQLRKHDGDPVNLALHVLSTAAQHARMHDSDFITEQDVTASLPPIFHLSDANQMRGRIKAVEDFGERAPLEVMGQSAAIEKLGNGMKSHILGLRDPIRPYTVLIPGPTGVGKTELMLKYAVSLNIPYFQIEGAEFSESHTVSRLVGSPSGYTGPDKGILYEFLEANDMGLVFVDEIEKMHPDVYQALMNWFDKGTLTAGNGESVSRPGHIIAGASNAGAESLHRGMSESEIKEVLADNFVDRNGNRRPELVRRFEVIPMLALESGDFEQLLRANIEKVGTRHGFINSNLRLAGFDNAAVQVLYNGSKDVCSYDEKGMGNRIQGFANPNRTIKGAFEISNPSEIISDGLFYDMRHVSRALDNLAGPSIQEFVRRQYDQGAHLQRGVTTNVQLVGDVENNTIQLDYVREPDSVTNGVHHAGNGHAHEGFIGPMPMARDMAEEETSSVTA